MQAREKGMVLGLVVSLLLLAASARATPVAMRYPEGPAHGFLSLTEVASGKEIAKGELLQRLQGRVVASQLIIRFEDGSLYDETMTFSQRPVFRVLTYRLVQRGPSFAESSDVRFDSSGAYEARVQKANEPEKHDAGRTDIPDDVMNGLSSVVAKNLSPHGSATMHMMSFQPSPVVLEVSITPNSTDRYWIGRAEGTATRYVVAPRVPGVKGALASVLGKQPEPVDFWIANGKAPILVRFEGALYLDGPTWRIGLIGPTWKD
jgi:hypothetical protein